ncbi:hypothetical protein [Micromonospora zamorensis]|uniref:hypothetical protein n=1 Tax=Micromonospora zamorensis TaxID=709883 RepID=UPI00378B9580
MANAAGLVSNIAKSCQLWQRLNPQYKNNFSATDNFGSGLPFAGHCQIWQALAKCIVSWEG